MEHNHSAVEQTIRAILWSKQKRPWHSHVMAILVCAIFSFLNIKSGFSLLSFQVGIFSVTFSHVLPMLLIGTMGYFDGMIFLTIQFFLFAYLDFDQSYLSFITLLMCGGFYFVCRRRWILSWKKIAITVISMSFLYGNLWLPLMQDIAEGQIIMIPLAQEFLLFFTAAPEVLLACVLVRVLFQNISDEEKENFYVGQFYTKFYEEEILPSGFDKGSRLGRQVSIGLTIDLLVMITATIALNGVVLGSNSYGDYMRSQGANPIALIIRMVLMLLSIVIPIVICSYYAFQTITIHPMRRMTEYIKGYSETNDTTREEYTKSLHEIKPSTNDEIMDLYLSTSRLVNDTTNYIERLQKEQQLEEDLAVEKAANEAKSQFLSNMSHEIRTPINAVLGFDEMIIRETQEMETLKYATDIKTAGETLLQIINDILDLSRIESGRLEIEEKRFDFSDTLNSLISMADVQANNKGLQFVTHINPDIPTFLRGDSMRIKQCILNILSNAVKYTEEGEVTFSVDYQEISSQNISLTVEVADTGIGIKKHDLSRIFTPYERLEDGIERHIQGTGLGLDIVGRLLEKMGSKLEVRSIYGEGSTFYFTIQLPVEGWEPLGDVFKRYEETKMEMNRYHESFQAPDAQILVIDDTNMNLMVIRGLLKRTRIQIDTADNGREALTMVTKKKYDMIFIDHKMPGMDGIETLHAMKELAANINQDTVKVALTANAISGAREEYISVGFDDYLSKPINMTKLEEMLIQYLPPSLVIRQDEDGFVNFVEEGANYQNNPDAEQAVDLSEFDDLEGIDIRVAYKNCDQIDILREALKEFYYTIEKKADDIQHFMEIGDYENYTVWVHALKGNARLIGAAKLSSDAAYLEQCGNERNADLIQKETPKLLEFYRSYLDKLAPIAARDQVDHENLQDITEQEFVGALRDLKELVEVFDYDNAISIRNMLDQYRIPEAYQTKWETIKERMAAVDMEGLLAELKDVIVETELDV